MVNMRMSPTEAAEYASATPSPGNAPLYPYGLTICLNNDSLKKLSMDAPPAVGAKFTLTAVVEVTSVRQNKEQDGDTNVGADLQITDMELSTPAKSVEPFSYSNSKHAG